MAEEAAVHVNWQRFCRAILSVRKKYELSRSFHLLTQLFNVKGFKTWTFPDNFFILTYISPT